MLGSDPGFQAEPVSPLLDAAVEMQLRLQYAMTIIRLVNGISDSSQKKKVAASVAALATSAGKSPSVDLTSMSSCIALGKQYPAQDPALLGQSFGTLNSWYAKPTRGHCKLQ